MEKELVHYETDRGVAVLQLDAPPANTYTYEMFRQLDEAILRARMDNEAQVIMLRGAGEKFFSAGADINMLQKADPTYKYYFCLHANETLLRLEKTPKLVIAALNGTAVGGGLEIAMACDMRIAKRDGGKIGLPEVSLGVLPGTGGTQRMARLIGKARALELIATGRTFAFDEALEIGLITRIIDGPDFHKAALEYARQFLPPNKAAKAIGHIKRSIQSGVEMDLYDGLALEQELQIQLFRSEDAREGLDSWVDKRVPRFKGK
ncbi:MAG: enoyl-CoA hydratase [Candidatus Rokuibacteriota bacterium]|nr:MAG: enoyl-CoA hydratase [Candidatus Rokubacteria bacterium]